MTAHLLLFAAFVLSMLLMSMNYKKKKKRVVFFGDSITEQGVKYGGYIRQLALILQEEGIDEEYELAGAGVSGDKVYDLYLRLDADVLSKGADVVVIFIGINDIEHKFSKLTGTDLQGFKAFYIAIIEKLLSAKISVVVCTPAVIGEHPAFETQADREIEVYADVIRALALQYSLPLVDLRKAFVSYNVTHNLEDAAQGILTIDKIHLNHYGNQLVAEEMWRILKEIKG